MFILKPILIIAVNALAFWGMAKYVPGFELTGSYLQILIIAFIFTLLNLILKPILKLLLGPIILLTLGIGLLAVNIVILYLLDILVDTLTIQGLALIYGALIIGGVNFVSHLLFKKK